MTPNHPRTAASSTLMTILGALWLALFPFWQDGSFSRITHSKWVGMLVLTGVTAIVSFHLIAAFLRRGEKDKLRSGAAQNIALIYFALVILSAILGTWHDILNDELQLTVLWGARRYEGLVTQLCYCVIFLCMSLAPPEPEGLLTAAADALLLYCGVVALQYVDINVLGLFPEGRSIVTNYEFQGTIGNIDMVVGYVSLVMPLLLCAFAMKQRGGWLWYVCGTAGVLLMLCMEVQSGLIVLAAMGALLILLALRRPALRMRVMLILAGMAVMLALRLMLRLPWLDGPETVGFRVTWLSVLFLLAGLGMVGAAWLLHRRPGKALSWRVLLPAAAAVCIAALIFVYAAPLPEGNGLWELQEILHGRMQDAFGSERIGIWRLTLEMSRKNLLLGTGPDTFLYAMGDHMKQTDQALQQTFDNPHNMLLAILSNNGLPAMIAFILLCAVPLCQALRRRERQPFLIPLALAAACYLLQGMFTFSICLVTPMFWAVMGMLTAGVNAAKPAPLMKGSTAYEPDVSDDPQL